MRENSHSGFTLIELSIVLVIIGLIVGGVLVGRDLIQAAEIRAQMSQIEKYKTAINTFRVKYNAIPGDMPSAQAAQVGFNTRAGGCGDGDGNGLIEGLGCASGWVGIMGGETVLFWTDLSSAQLIEGSFTDNTDAPVPDGTNLSPYFPAAKAGHNGSIFVFSDLYNSSAAKLNSGTYFEIANGGVGGGTGQTIADGGALSVIEAFDIDSKMDDGIPTTGTVTVAGPGEPGAGLQLQMIDNVFNPLDLSGGLNRGVYACAGSPTAYNINHPDSPACNLFFLINN